MRWLLSRWSGKPSLRSAVDPAQPEPDGRTGPRQGPSTTLTPTCSRCGARPTPRGRPSPGRHVHQPHQRVRPPGQPNKPPTQKVRPWVQQRAQTSREHQPKVLPVLTESASLLVLPEPMGGQGSDGQVGQPELPPGGRCLGGSEGDLAAGPHGGLPDPQLAGFQVDVVPVQRDTRAPERVKTGKGVAEGNRRGRFVMRRCAPSDNQYMRVGPTSISARWTWRTLSAVVDNPAGNDEV